MLSERARSTAGPQDATARLGRPAADASCQTTGSQTDGDTAGTLIPIQHRSHGLTLPLYHKPHTAATVLTAAAAAAPPSAVLGTCVGVWRAWDGVCYLGLIVFGKVESGVDTILGFSLHCARKIIIYWAELFLIST